MARNLNEIPPSLREYFASETTTAIIHSITKEAGLSRPGAIPHLVYRLITKDLTAHDFVDGAAEQLGVSARRAHAIARALKELVLERVRNELFVWGVDISAINTVNAPSLNDVRIGEKETDTEGTSTPATGRTVQLEVAGSIIAPEQTVPVRPVPSFLSRGSEKQPPKQAPGAPLIIHEENTSPSAPPQNNLERSSSSR